MAELGEFGFSLDLSTTGILKVPDEPSRLALSPTDGDPVIQLDNHHLYIWDAGTSTWMDMGSTAIETDPIFTAWLAGPPNVSEFTNDAGYLTSFTETDPIFSAWLLATPPLYSETDPVFSAWLLATPPLYSFTETDPIFSAWATANDHHTNWDTAYSLSHAAVTLGTANGLSLSTQALSLALAATGTAGAVAASGTPATNQYLKAAITTGAISWAQIAYADLSGAPAQPFSVSIGGTGRNTGTSAFGIICAGTTATNPQQTIANSATAGTFLLSAGASALPAYSTNLTWDGNTLSALSIASPQLKLAYDGSNYSTTQVDSNGVCTVLNTGTIGDYVITPVGSSAYTNVTSDAGKLNFGGTTNTNNESLLWDFETVADQVGVSSLSGVTKIAFTAIDFDMSANDWITDTTTGSKFGTGATQKIGLWGTTPNVQPTTAITASAFVANTSGTLNDTATWDGYTIGQIVAALRRLGALA